MKIIFVLLIIVASLIQCYKIRLDNHTLYNIRITTPQLLKEFLEEFPEYSLDIWSHDSSLVLNSDMQIHFTRQQSKTLEKFINRTNLQATLLCDNLQVVLDREIQENQRIQKEQENVMRRMSSLEERKNFLFSDEEYYKKYQNYSTILEYINHLKQKYPNMVNIVSIGKTYEGRDIMAMQIYSPKTPYNDTKKGVFINSILHAREWLAPAVTQYIASRILLNYETDTRVQRLLDHINIHYVPIVNVDGFVYTHTNYRMWRKNRRRNSGGSYGVDLNRNLDSGWGRRGASSDPRSDVYKGASPVSEHENQAIRDYIQANKQIKASIDYHTYAEVILRPFAYTQQSSAHEKQFQQLGLDMVNAIRSVHGKVYRNLKTFDFYPASGILSDYCYEKLGLMGFSIELSPRGFGVMKEEKLAMCQGGFDPPPSLILPSAKENYQAFLKFLEFVEQQNYWYF